jgi:hypothetical protein
VSYGYGFEVALLTATPPRSAVVAYLDAASGTPATTNGISRGAAIVTVDGVDLANGADVATLNAGLFPTTGGNHTLVIRDLGSATTRTVTLLAQPITETPVQNVKTLNVGGASVGYMLFNDHIATSESELIAAVTQLKNSGVTDLVLDIRYNGGGYLDIASELAYMIAGVNNTTGKFFEREMYNDRNPFNLTTAHHHRLPFDHAGLLGGGGNGAAEPGPEPRLRADDGRHVLGQRSDRQRPAGRRRHGQSHRRHDLRQALRLLPQGQLQHHLFRDPVPGGQQCQLR